MERVWGAPDLLRLAGVLALSLLFFGVSAPAWAAPLRVGLDSNYPPFSLVDRRGHASGFDLEVAEELNRAIRSIRFSGVFGRINRNYFPYTLY